MYSCPDIQVPSHWTDISFILTRHHCPIPVCRFMWREPIISRNHLMLGIRLIASNYSVRNVPIFFPFTSVGTFSHITTFFSGLFLVATVLVSVVVAAVIIRVEAQDGRFSFHNLIFRNGEQLSSDGVTIHQSKRSTVHHTTSEPSIPEPSTRSPVTIDRNVPNPESTPEDIAPSSTTSTTTTESPIHITSSVESLHQLVPSTPAPESSIHITPTEQSEHSTTITSTIPSPTTSTTLAPRHKHHHHRHSTTSAPVTTEHSTKESHYHLEATTSAPESAKHIAPVMNAMEPPTSAPVERHFSSMRQSPHSVDLALSTPDRPIMEFLPADGSSEYDESKPAEEDSLRVPPQYSTTSTTTHRPFRRSSKRPNRPYPPENELNKQVPPPPETETVYTAYGEPITVPKMTVQNRPTMTFPKNPTHHPSDESPSINLPKRDVTSTSTMSFPETTTQHHKPSISFPKLKQPSHNSDHTFEIHLGSESPEPSHRIHLRPSFQEVKPSPKPESNRGHDSSSHESPSVNMEDFDRHRLERMLVDDDTATVSHKVVVPIQVLFDSKVADRQAAANDRRQRNSRRHESYKTKDDDDDRFFEMNFNVN